MRAILVTGAGGFIGRNVIPALLADGWDVLALGRAVDRMPSFERGVRVVEGDVNDTDVLDRALAHVDAVCHLAAYLPPNYEDAEQAEFCLRTNALATLELARAATKRIRGRFIHFSSASAYCPGNGVVTEASPMYPASRATYYLTSKLAGELFVEHTRTAGDLDSVGFRLSSVYGCGMTRRSVISDFVERAGRGLPLKVWDGGLPTGDFVHVKDIVELIVRALRDGEPGMYNVGSGAAHSVLEVAHAVAATFPERRVAIEVSPAGDTVPMGVPALSVEKAARMWGYAPMSLTEGLAAYRRELERAPQ